MPELVLLRAAASALLPRRPPPEYPLHLERVGVRAEPGRVAAYARVCRARHVDPLPVLYPHVLAFGLTMRLMSRRDFPFPAPGLVHVHDVVTQRRPIGRTDPLDLLVTFSTPRPHRRGHVVDVHTDVSTGGRLVWSQRSTYLRRETRARGTAAPSTTDDDTADWPAIDRWPAGPATGRRYASVSGDHNPIHLTTLTARPFGFPRAIAHGMWTTARALSSLLPDPDGAVRVSVDFVSPVALPTTLLLVRAPSGDRFAVRSPGGRVHVKGTLAIQDDAGRQDAASSI